MWHLEGPQGCPDRHGASVDSMSVLHAAATRCTCSEGDGEPQPAAPWVAVKVAVSAGRRREQRLCQPGALSAV
jgi:hypothetical protein